MESVEQCLLSKNPISREIPSFLISYKEEDDRLDYKLEIDTNSEKHWFELSKDILKGSPIKELVKRKTHTSLQKIKCFSRKHSLHRGFSL